VTVRNVLALQLQLSPRFPEMSNLRGADPGTQMNETRKGNHTVSMVPLPRRQATF